jgi:hypothetical protein
MHSKAGTAFLKFIEESFLLSNNNKMYLLCPWPFLRVRLAFLDLISHGARLPPMEVMSSRRYSRMPMERQPASEFVVWLAPWARFDAGPHYKHETRFADADGFLFLLNIRLHVSANAFVTGEMFNYSLRWRKCIGSDTRILFIFGKMAHLSNAIPAWVGNPGPLSLMCRNAYWPGWPGQ